MNSAYKITSIGGKAKYQHRVVWESAFGAIPEGFHVHHKNGNKRDNRIENLEIVEKSVHHKHHMQEVGKTKEHKDRCREMAKKSWSERPLVEVVCQICGTVFMAKVHNWKPLARGCSESCKCKIYYIEKGRDRHFAKKNGAINGGRQEY